MKIVYFGNHNVGCLCLNKLLLNNICPVLVVVLRHDKDEHLSYESVAEIAKNNNIETFEYSPLQKDILFSKLKEIAPDLIISVAWRYIFKRDILSIPRMGAINFHGSMLPKCRGANPTNWAIICGEKETGVTVHFIDEGVDTGDIIIQEAIPIDLEDTAYTLRMKQDKLSEKLMGELIKYIKIGKFSRVKQDSTIATCFRKRKHEDGLIKWKNMTSVEIYNFVRALTRPYPGAFSYINDRKVTIWKVAIYSKTYQGTPGQIIAMENEHPIVITREGCVTLLDFECAEPQFTLMTNMYFNEA